MWLPFWLQSEPYQFDKTQIISPQFTPSFYSNSKHICLNHSKFAQESDSLGNYYVKANATSIIDVKYKQVNINNVTFNEDRSS